MSALRQMYDLGVKRALAKFALGPPTQVDQFMADIEQGKDVPPESAMPPMAAAPGGPLPALDGTTPMSTSPPTPADTIGSTVGQPPPPPSMGMLGG